MGKITVELDKSEKIQDDQSLYLSFDYSPQTVQDIKTLPVRYYDPSNHTWEVPTVALKNIIELFGRENLEMSEDVEKICTEMKEGTNEIPSEKDRLKSDVDVCAIKDDSIREFTLKALDSLPEYFYQVAASSTGKYHPKYCLGTGGLVRHTRAALAIAKELFRNNTVCHFTEKEKDIILASLALHDGVKHGMNGSRYTTVEHPLEVIKYLQEKEDLMVILPEETLDLIFDCIGSHMGEWNKNREGKEVLPLPKSTMQKFVHLCDYLASRKCLEVNFEETL